MIFSYNIKKGKVLEKVINTNIQYHNYQHHKLPITMDPLKYGRLINQHKNIFNVQVNENDTNIAEIIQEDNKNLVEFFRKGVSVYEYIDKWIDNNTFTRILENKNFTLKIMS
jgi:hypothetical protein